MGKNNWLDILKIDILTIFKDDGTITNMISNNSKQISILFFLVSIWLWFEALFGHWSILKKTC